MVFCCVGTGFHWLFKRDAVPGRDLKYYLYGTRLQGESLKRCTCNSENGYCRAFSDRFHAAYAFAIIASIVAGIAFFLAVATFLIRKFEKPLKATTLGLAIFAFICNLITWALAATLYRRRFCGASLTPNQAGVELSTSCFSTFPSPLSTHAAHAKLTKWWPRAQLKIARCWCYTPPVRERRALFLQRSSSR